MTTPRDGDRVEVRTQGIWRNGRVETDPLTRWGFTLNPAYDVVEVLADPVVFKDGDVVNWAGHIGQRYSEGWNWANNRIGHSSSDQAVGDAIRLGNAWLIDTSKPKDA